MAESSRTRTITAVAGNAVTDAAALSSRWAYGMLGEVSGSPGSGVGKTPRATDATANGGVPRAAVGAGSG
ncbi:hypothetical protein [Streptomyces californicus]|uniref:hypothetical protein n=1 Tax=Streptomyces californicus TaxID=67351 RepID=UPI0037A90D38